MSESKILLGFEVSSGKPVYIPLHHMVITGMTQLSGKTTTIEALIHRSGLRPREERKDLSPQEKHCLSTSRKDLIGSTFPP